MYREQRRETEKREGRKERSSHHTTEGGWVRHQLSHESEAFGIPELQWTVLILNYQVIPSEGGRGGRWKGKRDGGTREGGIIGVCMITLTCVKTLAQSRWGRDYWTPGHPAREGSLGPSGCWSHIPHCVSDWGPLQMCEPRTQMCAG